MKKFQNENNLKLKVISLENRFYRKLNYFLYHGQSMKGVFHTGDCLYVEYISIEKIKPGDIVIYRGLNGKGEERELVHRVIGKSSQGLITKGDNNLSRDNAVVGPDNYLGRVISYERNGKQYRVHGGLRGRIYARLFHLRVLIWKALSYILRPPYCFLRQSGIVSRLWHPNIQKIYFQTENGPVIKYLCKGRTIACWRPAQNYFEYRKPYDMVLWDKVFLSRE